MPFVNGIFGADICQHHLGQMNQNGPYRLSVTPAGDTVLEITMPRKSLNILPDDLVDLCDRLEQLALVLGEPFTRYLQTGEALVFSGQRH